MLDEVNDPDLDINEVVRRHFNRENYLSWLAFNILIENIDTSSRNFYLYSPASQSAWYFVPWDYDGAWGFYDQPNQQLVPIRARWQNGLANYWGTPLHRRFLSDPANRRDLESRMVELKNGPLSLAAIDQRLNAYHPVVRPFIAREPDISALPSVPGTPKPGQFDAEYARIRDGVVRNHTSYLATLGRPMPFFLGEPEKGPEGWAFVWDESIDLQEDAITYDFQVSRTKDFSSADIAFAKVGLTGNSLTVTEPLPAGTYFWRVTARETALPDVNWQWPFDSHYDVATDRLSFGMRMFVVE
jgi:spore coat protein H